MNEFHVLGLPFPNIFQSFPKNPTIAQLFTQLGRSEELGIERELCGIQCKVEEGIED